MRRGRRRFGGGGGEPVWRGVLSFVAAMRTIALAESSLFGAADVSLPMTTPVPLLPPFWISQPPNSAVFSNSTGLRLECSAGGDPAPVVEWFQEDAVITRSLNGLRVLLDNGTMVFPPFRGDRYRGDVHRASYHCRATNRLGTIFTRSVRITAVVDEDFSVTVTDAIAIRGNSAVLRCEIGSSSASAANGGGLLNDLVHVTSWLHEEGTAIEIFPEKEPRGKYTLLPGGHLLVHHTSAYDSYKKYTCKAENSLTKERRRNMVPARLILTEPDGAVPPRLVQPRSSSSSSERTAVTRWVGESALLPCVSEGFPVPESTWFRFESPSGSLRQVLPSPRVKYHLEVLVLRRLLVEDSGIYVCIMNNTVGSQRIEVNLVVRSPLETRADPAEQTVDLNRPAVFKCAVLGHPVKGISWYKDGRQLHRGSRYHISLNATLKIYSVQEGDEGSYQCVAKNDDDAGHSTGYLWLGDALPVLLFKFSEQTMQPGPSVSLKCIAKGNPTPRIEWRRDGFPLQQVDRYFVGQYVTVHDDVISHVNISDVVSTDGGAYACIASNSVGASRHSARLNVYGPPRVRPIPSVKSVEGGTISVTCPVSGYPIQSIIWQKDGYELPSDGRQKVFPNGTLTISTASKSADEGYYTCTAFNRRDESDSGNAHIQVTTPPTIMPFLFPNSLLNEGMRSAVSCQILEGNLPIAFGWDKNGGRLQLSPGGAEDDDATLSIRSNDQYSSTLIIDRLQFRHRGNYTCTASNAAGSATHTAELTVNVPPKFLQEPQDVVAVEGQDILVPCVVEGFPDPVIKWNHEPSSSSRDHLPGKSESGSDPGDAFLAGMTMNQQFPNGSLLLTLATKSMEGAYTCTATNGIKYDIRKTINVTVNAPPRFRESSERLSVRKGDRAVLECVPSAGDRPMDLFWRRNGIDVMRGEDARFAVEVQENDDTDGEATTTKSRFIVEPVLEQDAGQFTCEVANRYGRDQKHFVVSIEDVPSPPTSVHLSGIGSRSLEITWTTEHNGNSPILNYIIEYSNVPDDRDSGEVERRKMTAAGDSLSLVVQNLRPGTTYDFRVSAENKHGVSRESQTVSAQMLDEAPASPPRNLEAIPVSSTELQVTWDSPPFAHWNSETLSYKIGYKAVGRTTGLEFLDLPASGASSQEFSLRGLGKFTSYQVVARAYNSQGEGPASTSVVATTLEDVPSGPPLDVRCQGVSPDTVSIEWSKPRREERNGIIRGYSVRYYPTTLCYESSGRIETVETEGESVELKGLETYSNYSVAVAAFTRAGAAGDDAAAARVFCMTAEDVPSGPADVRAVTSGPGSVMVSWRPPGSPNGVIKKYTVFRREVMNGEEVEVKESSVLSGPNYLELTGLEWNRRYDVWVKAATDVGYGSSSIITSIILGRIVRARIVSFGGALAVPWKTYLVLDCLHVGEPAPSIQWQHEGAAIQENSKYQIFPNGSLSVHRLTESDQGEYSCGVQNMHGRDQIDYDIIVQVPPSSPPSVAARNATSSGLEISWQIMRSQKRPVLGYSVNFRSEHGEWQQSDADPLSDSLWITGLACGNNYSVYVTAYNHVGASLPSSVLVSRTLGRVPDIPHLPDLILANRSLVTLRLDAFRDGGCPIQYFVIEYRRESEHNFKLVASNVSAREDTRDIAGLEPATRYYIRVTAYNAAGSSVAEYPFATLTTYGATIPPPRGTHGERSADGDVSSSSGDGDSFVAAVKVTSILFLSVALIVTTFYVAIFARRWKKKRDISMPSLSSRYRYPFRPRSPPPQPPPQLVSLATTNADSTAALFDTATTTSSVASVACASGTSFAPASANVVATVACTPAHRQQGGEGSPMLPPNTFRASEVKFDCGGGGTRGRGNAPPPQSSASAGLLLTTATSSCNAEGGGNVFLQPGDIVATWTEAGTADICPYAAAAATVQMPHEQQVTLKFIPDHFGNFCHQTAMAPPPSRQFGTAAAAISDGTATLRSLQGTTSSFKPQHRLAHHDMNNAPLTREPVYATLLRRPTNSASRSNLRSVRIPSREDLLHRHQEHQHATMSRTEGKRPPRFVTLQVDPATHYDSDSDFDYRLHQRPPRPPPFRGRRGQRERRRSSSSSSSTTSSSSSSSDVDFSPLPRVRSIEAALDRDSRGATAPPTRFLQAASLQRQRSASMRGQSWKDQWRTMGGRTKFNKFRQLQIQGQNRQQQQETNFINLSGTRSSVLPPPAFIGESGERQQQVPLPPPPEIPPKNGKRGHQQIHV